MDAFFNTIADKIAVYRTELETQGFSDDQVTEKTLEKFNGIAKDYYGKLMEMLSETDYQEYKKCIDSQDMDGIQAVMGKYKDQITKLQEDFLENIN